MSSSKNDPPAKGDNSQYGMPVLPEDTPTPPEDPEKKRQAVFNLIAVGGIVIAQRYATASKQLQGTGYQANHRNQDAAYRDKIPYNDGLTNPLHGNPNQPSSPHG
jgi:hypothetical protein